MPAKDKAAPTARFRPLYAGQWGSPPACAVERRVTAFGGVSHHALVSAEKLTQATSLGLFGHDTQASPREDHSGQPWPRQVGEVRVHSTDDQSVSRGRAGGCVHIRETGLLASVARVKIPEGHS